MPVMAINNNNNEDPSLNNAMTILQDALNDDTHEFWSEFGKQLDRSPSATVAEIRRAVQEKDDLERKAQGLDPRPWEDLEKELEGQSNQFLENFDNEVLKFDAQQREEKGLEPRSAEELVLPSRDLEACAELMKKVVMKFDANKRKEMGLEARSWEAFEEAFVEEHGLEYVDEGEESEETEKAASL
ncbi:MAG: hypothetical protein Q9222_001889 [Ikaeria aurantiellina]